METLRLGTFFWLQTSATYDFLLKKIVFHLLSVKNLKIPLNVCWVLWFQPNYFDYGFGQLLVFDGCVFFRFITLSANDGDMGKMWILKVVWNNV